MNKTRILIVLLVGVLVGWLLRQNRARFRQSRSNEALFPALAHYYDIAAGTDYDAKEDAWSDVIHEVVNTHSDWTELERTNIHRMLTQSKPNWFDYAEAQAGLNE